MRTKRLSLLYFEIQIEWWVQSTFKRINFKMARCAPWGRLPGPNLWMIFLNGRVGCHFQSKISYWRFLVFLMAFDHDFWKTCRMVMLLLHCVLAAGGGGGGEGGITFTGSSKQRTAPQPQPWMGIMLVVMIIITMMMMMVIMKWGENDYLQVTRSQFFILWILTMGTVLLD